MNVTKCMNGHFFDADKYQLCPHCGAAAITSDDASKSTETKKSHVSFWGKKKPEVDDNSVVEMPEGTIGKTFGVFGSDETDEVVADAKKVVEPVVEETHNKIAMCSNCGKEYDASLAVCPHCKPIITSDELDKSSVVLETEDEEKANSASSEGSLHEAVKKAVSGNDGKTVGFFSTGAGNSDVSIDSEPVVGWLVCIKGKHFGESFNISAGRNAIGRADSNKIIIAKDESVSRNKHAWLTYEPKKREFFIQPGEGSGLSYLNGDNVMESRKLQARDILEFGNGQYMLIPLCGENFTWEDHINKE